MAAGSAAGPEGAVGILTVVAAEVGSGDADAATEGCFEGHEAHQRCGPVVGSAERFYVRATAVAGARDDVDLAVAVHVADADVDAAAEVGIIRDQLIQRPRNPWQSRTVKYTDDRAATIAR